MSEQVNPYLVIGTPGSGLSEVGLELTKHIKAITLENIAIDDPTNHDLTYVSPEAFLKLVKHEKAAVVYGYADNWLELVPMSKGSVILVADAARLIQRAYQASPAYRSHYLHRLIEIQTQLVQSARENDFPIFNIGSRPVIVRTKLYDPGKYMELDNTYSQRQVVDAILALL